MNIETSNTNIQCKCTCHLKGRKECYGCACYSDEILKISAAQWYKNQYRESWRDVRGCLPVDMSKVLVWFVSLYGEPKIAFYHKGSFYVNQHSDEELTKWVTHWMPLPDSPEGEIKNAT